LSSLNDDDFKSIYLFHLDVDDSIDSDIYDQFETYDYAYAYISKKLINRCLAISSEPLKCLTKIHTFDSLHINFSIDSCKLLYMNQFDVIDLLYIACCAKNQESLNYLLNQYITPIDYANLIIDTRFEYNCISSIPIMDNIYKHSSEDMRALFRMRHIIPDINLNNNQDINLDINLDISQDINKITIKCYYIIKHMTQDDAISYMKKLDENYIENNYENNFNMNQLYLWHKKLLAHYFKPRGSYTKSAIHPI
jgi:hypothetical protein